MEEKGCQIRLSGFPVEFLLRGRYLQCTRYHNHIITIKLLKYD